MSDENITTWPKRISLYQGENGEPIHYIRTDLVKPTMTVEKAREILKDNPNVFIFENGSIDLARDKTKICLGEETYTADELEAIAFLMRKDHGT